MRRDRYRPGLLVLLLILTVAVPLAILAVVLLIEVSGHPLP